MHMKLIQIINRPHEEESSIPQKLPICLLYRSCWTSIANSPSELAKAIIWVW